jgi:hypothetical protein
MEVQDACEYCGGSGGKTFVDDSGELYDMCKSCSDKEEVCSTCKACKIGCLYDNSLRHGLCEDCCELCVNSDKFHDAMLRRIGEKKDEYDALVLEVNRALRLPDKEGTFAMLGKCDEDEISVFADKMISVDLQKFPMLYIRTEAFYKEIEGHAIQTCLDTPKPEATEVVEDAKDSEPAKKKQKINS